jgi:NAD(P)-dependent dehydrogenase (short-subunit alcohol dehydrogenase family)
MAAVQKVAIVTGASKGIGAGLVTAFLERGYGVVANSRNIAKDDPFRGYGSLALVEGDIADSITSARIADAALSRFGRIDVLANNAGVYMSKSFTDCPTVGRQHRQYHLDAGGTSDRGREFLGTHDYQGGLGSGDAQLGNRVRESGYSSQRGCTRHRRYAHAQG